MFSLPWSFQVGKVFSKMSGMTHYSRLDLLDAALPRHILTACIHVVYYESPLFQIKAPYCSAPELKDVSLHDLYSVNMEIIFCSFMSFMHRS